VEPQLVISFIGHFHIVTTGNCSAIANSHTQQFATARIKSSQSAVSSLVFAWQRLPMANIPLTPASRTIPEPQLLACNSSMSQRLNCSSLTNSPANYSLPCIALTLTNCPAYNISTRTPRKTPFLCRCSLVNVRNLFPSRGRCLQSHYLATGLHATLLKFPSHKIILRIVNLILNRFHISSVC
jgi:hypothetical protein